MINEEVRYIVEAELKEGEKLLWADESNSRIYTLLIAGVVFVILMPITVLLLEEPNRVPLLIFVLLFSIVYCWYCFHSSSRIGRSKYAITNQRVIFYRPNWPKKSFSLNPSEYVTFLSEGNKQGTITFIKKGMNPLFKIFAPKTSLIHPKIYKVSDHHNAMRLIEETS